MVVVNKYIDVYKHDELIDETIWNFPFLTNDTQSPCCQIVHSADGRCKQENMTSAQKWSSCFLRSCGYFAYQLGLHSVDGFGPEPQELVGVRIGRKRSAERRTVPSAEAFGFDVRVSHVRGVVGVCAGSSRSQRPSRGGSFVRAVHASIGHRCSVFKILLLREKDFE